MFCKCCRDFYNKLCFPCIHTRPESRDTLPPLPKDIKDTLGEVNISTSPTPVDTDNSIHNDYKNTYGTDVLSDIQNRKIIFTIDNDYIRKSSDSIEPSTPANTDEDNQSVSNSVSV